ncbi:SCO4225 family membrane protein [Actinomadura rudentiformis]|uniref:Uncharacterized protein n=1 Tax=Actinomadura rudentiformis TaxID=359158 RepID=A0A6H9YU15_9ACTN|nr:hypothetical protein [Actinomadura rudentiformis]KAB2344798.1 hypothetical protein F8566_29805 [Actinomadura rudentiformis]
MFRRLSQAAAARSTGWFGIIVPAVYATLVIAVTLVVLADSLFVAHDDASLMGVWLILVTLPLSGASLSGLSGLESLLGEMPQPLKSVLFYLATTGVGLVQAWLLRLATRGRLRESDVRSRVPVS